ncbi:hypothetical protein SLS57_011470 [Botryosphaeria dothidea]
MYELVQQTWAAVLHLDVAEILDDSCFFELPSFRAFYEHLVTVPKRRDSARHGEIEEVVSRVDIGPDVLESALQKLNMDPDSAIKAAVMTPHQEGILMLSLEGNFGLLNYIYEVDGGAGLHSRLASALHLLAAKNPVFRTTAIKVESDTCFAQVLLRRSNHTFSRRDSLRAYLDETKKPRDPFGRPAVQCRLIEGDPAMNGKTFFVMSIVHLFCDGFSHYLLDQDLHQVLQAPDTYAAEARERPWFGDFANRLRWHSDDRGAAEFWTEYLDGARFSNLHEGLPAKFTFCTGGNNIVRQSVPKSGLKDCPEMVNQTAAVVSAWCLAVARHSASRDVVFGLFRHGRSSRDEDTRHMIGPLSTITPIRMRIQDLDETVESFVGRMQQEILSTARWEQGHIPGIWSTDEGVPWVQSVINVKPSLKKATQPVDMRQSNGDCALNCFVPRRDLEGYSMDSEWTVLTQVRETEDDLVMELGHHPTRLDTVTTMRLMQEFCRILQGIGRASGQRVGELIQ